MPFKKILIAVDGSDTGSQAFEAGTALALPLGSALALVHVVEPMVGLPQDPPINTVELMAIAEKSSQQLLSGLQKRVPPPLPSTVFSPMGAASNEIQNVARDWGADLIVIGSHGRSGISRVLMGSVAEDVMRHAHVPVLVVRR